MLMTILRLVGAPAFAAFVLLALASGWALGQQPPSPYPPLPQGSYYQVVPAREIPAAEALGATPADNRDDALNEVNALRAARGLRPFVRDEGLTQAARGAAAWRARFRVFGHTPDDFAFCPPGTHSHTAGCAAYPPSYGWKSCDVDEPCLFGGAAWAWGGDGKRYMHLFCSHRPSAIYAAGSDPLAAPQPPPGWASSGPPAAAPLPQCNPGPSRPMPVPRRGLFFRRR